MTLRRITTKKVNEAGSSGERPNTVGLSERNLHKVLDAMDQRDSGTGASANREFARWPFREERVTVTLVHPGGTEVVLNLAARNLSKGGLGVLHSAFVYPDTTCTVALSSNEGANLAISGKVTRCVHLRGVVHELGIMFDEEIDPRRVVEADVMEGRLSYEKVEPNSIEGSVIVAEPLPGDVQAIRRAVRRTRAEMIEVDSGKAAIEEAKKGARVIISAFDLPDMTGGELATNVRDAGLSTAVIVTSNEDGWRIQRGLEGHPVATFLKKPLEIEPIFRALAEFCALNEEDADQDGGLDARAVFCEQSATTAVQLERAAASEDAMQVYTVAERMAETAPKLGFTELGEVASTVAEKLSENLVFDEARDEVGQLIELCKNLAA
ncbi:MAG: response regulator [Planctomycetota bacterium]